MTTRSNDGEPEQMDGYRPHSARGPRVRTDVVDVYVFTLATPAEARTWRALGVEVVEHASAPTDQRVSPYFLQVLRSGEPLMGTWHPVMGHVEEGETAVQCARRELREELGITSAEARVRGFHALEQVHPFYIAAIEAIVMSPRFALEVAPGWSPVLNDEHSAARWVPASRVGELFMWPGQIRACQEVLDHVIPPTAPAPEKLRLPWP